VFPTPLTKVEAERQAGLSIASAASARWRQKLRAGRTCRTSSLLCCSLSYDAALDALRCSKAIINGAGGKAFKTEEGRLPITVPPRGSGIRQRSLDSSERASDVPRVRGGLLCPTWLDRQSRKREAQDERETGRLLNTRPARHALRFRRSREQEQKRRT
jgi:hypothetical protein